MDRGGPCPVLALVVALALSQSHIASAKEIIVNEAKDTPSPIKGACPGSHCNLRSAFGVAGWNDTISLTVSPVLDDFIATIPPPIPHAHGTFTLRASPPSSPKKTGISISPSSSGFGFLRTSNWPWTPTNGFLSLSIEGIEFTGFNWTSTGPSKAGGFVLCIASGPEGQSCDTVPVSSPTGEAADGISISSSSSLFPRRDWNSLDIEGDAPLEHSPLRPSDVDPSGSSTPLSTPMLRLYQVSFTHNTIYGGGGDANPSIAYLGCTAGWAVECPLVVEESRFLDNTITGYEGVGLAIFTGGSVKIRGAFTPTLIKDSQFISNRLLTHAGPFAYGGAILGISGEYTITGSTFVNNLLGMTRSVIRTNLMPTYGFVFHATIIGSTFANNEGNQASKPSLAATLAASWIVISGSFIDIPKSCPPIATLSKNDQYIVNTAISTRGANAVQISGYQVFNRDPIFTNLSNGTTSELGFANCAEGKYWLPCPSGTHCKEAMNHGVVVGYYCR